MLLLGSALAQDATFAVVGDFGDDDEDSAAVAAMVHGWSPDFVLSVGDNDYSDGAWRGTSEGLELGVGQHYADLIGDYQGRYGAGATTNRFFPTPGDHDWGDTCDDPGGLDDYLAYFTLPPSSSGNERYYDFRQGPVHFFALDSMEGDCEPDGSDASSVQARWVRDTAAASDAPFKVAFFHHPPWSSGEHGTDGDHMQWPWRDWGFDLVMAGHDHDYERVWRDGVTSLVVGLGGVDIRGFDCAVAGSQVRYDGDYGALKVDVYADHLDVRFLALGDVEIDRFEVPLGGGLPTSTVADVPAQECTGCGCAAARTSGRWVILVAVGVPLLLLGARRRRRDD